MTSKEALEMIVVDLVPKAKENNKEEIELIEKDLEVLSKYKDIEEDLGIDLVTLFNTKEVYCKCDVKTYKKDKQGFLRQEIIFGAIVKRELMSFNFQDKSIQCGSKWSFSSHKLKDYGKTWALTKKELERNKL